mmetsp:Transcript_17668/g.49041  ORF Transcript_17668/g.49041 Transcript_17668/m.49041 type:complete len:235 (-) Transcript_17668:176-880(-)
MILHVVTLPPLLDALLIGHLGCFAGLAEEETFLQLRVSLAVVGLLRDDVGRKSKNELQGAVGEKLGLESTLQSVADEVQLHDLLPGGQLQRSATKMHHLGCWKFVVDEGGLVFAKDSTQLLLGFLGDVMGRLHGELRNARGHLINDDLPFGALPGSLLELGIVVAGILVLVEVAHADADAPSVGSVCILLSAISIVIVSTVAGANLILLLQTELHARFVNDDKTLTCRSSQRQS